MRYHLSLAVLSLLGATSVATADRRPCGFKIAPCPTGEICQKVDPGCDRGENCQGYCVPAATPTTLVTKTTASPPEPTYQFCGGFANIQCENENHVCIDAPDDNCDPRNGGADCGGICVEPVFCGGIAGLQCPDGKRCIDDPRDRCDPKNGGADCGGICV
ncbi:hypothetical protein MYCTH_2300032 [Thermothelomyces thermophilus ATCC 42464]|uniref:Uncharacterized protein n=1 Tax=Thermothelomyces thermophilus (strain ATCC 42464 / BCRC 31852 / DSM 1799) TaxID=573729 RepID=G2QA68_THET4|nr:uncharacterized protein MYCTH_2300032 [Thermothelomyces thermophilus ATCC 42464]AEO55816.1 hypothetical protein MYCTH_2300032 [Thermothelomyces thermophilus ATCC 42464]